MTFKVRPNWSIGTVFGATNNVAVDATSGQATGLVSGATASRADLVLLYNENTLGYDQYFYSTGTNSWQQVGGDGSEQATAPIHIHEGVLIKRKGATNLTVSLNGEVKLGQTIVPITSAGAAAGFNFRSNVYPLRKPDFGQ